MTDKDLVRLHSSQCALTTAEFNRLLLKAKLCKAIGKAIVFTGIVLATAIVGKYLG